MRIVSVFLQIVYRSDKEGLVTRNVKIYITFRINMRINYIYVHTIICGKEEVFYTKQMKNRQSVVILLIFKM